VEITNLVTKLLGPPEEFIENAAHPTHLYRWMIFGNKRFRVYLHHSLGDDWNENLCREPKSFISLGFVKSGLEDGPRGIDILSDRAAWMVLIGRSSQSATNGSARH